MQSLKKRVQFAVAEQFHAEVNVWIQSNNVANYCDYQLVNVSDESQLDNLSFNADICVVHVVPTNLIDRTIDQNPNLKWMHSLSAGVDTVCKSTNLMSQDNKIELTNAKGCFSQFLAEYGLFGILWHSKRADHWRNLQKQSKWEKGTVSYTGLKTLGVVGYGDIGYRIAKAAKLAQNMKVIALKRDINNVEPEKRQYADELVDFSKLEYLCKNSDYIVSILPNTPETTNFFTKDVFSMMKPNCCFMNFGRGESIVEQDLVEALENKIIDAAVLDVFTPEPLPESSKLWAMENVFITPHSADNVDNLIIYSLEKWNGYFTDYTNGVAFKDAVDIKKGY